jgi:hypothetical protein
MRSSLTFTLAALLAAAAVTPAGAQPERRDDRIDHAIDAHSKWDKLGERWVQSKYDKDTIRVGKRAGKYRRIKLVVEHSAVELYDIKITFANGKPYSPGTRLVFGKDSTSRTIDLPGDARFIRRIDFKYGNLPGGGKAQVEVWGLHQ